MKRQYEHIQNTTNESCKRKKNPTVCILDEHFESGFLKTKASERVIKTSLSKEKGGAYFIPRNLDEEQVYPVQTDPFNFCDQTHVFIHGEKKEKCTVAEFSLHVKQDTTTICLSLYKSDPGYTVDFGDYTQRRKTTVCCSPSKTNTYTVPYEVLSEPTFNSHVHIVLLCYIDKAIHLCRLNGKNEVTKPILLYTGEFEKTSLKCYERYGFFFLFTKPSELIVYKDDVQYKKINTNGKFKIMFVKSKVLIIAVPDYFNREIDAYMFDKYGKMKSCKIWMDDYDPKYTKMHAVITRHMYGLLFSDEETGNLLAYKLNL